MSEALAVPVVQDLQTIDRPITAAELKSRLRLIQEVMAGVMQPEIDYGKIPGTDKPTLLKPGAEKLSVLFQLDVQLSNEKQWGPGEHLTVVSHATVFHAPTGSRLGYGEGVCTTRERKYAKRKQERTCPSCGEAAVIKGKAEYGGGWLCWKKRGGCGAKFADGAPEIEDQEAGEIENPDLPDLWNTVVKMAEKRARVDAVLAVTGASALFTQDIEDAVPAPDAEAEPPARPPRRPTPGTSAQAPEPTEKVASAKQRSMLHALAEGAGLSREDYVNVILAVVGSEAKTFESDDDAANYLHRMLDRLPEKHVTAIKKALEAAT